MAFQADHFLYNVTVDVLPIPPFGANCSRSLRWCILVSSPNFLPFCLAKDANSAPTQSASTSFTVWGRDSEESHLPHTTDKVIKKPSIQDTPKIYPMRTNFCGSYIYFANAPHLTIFTILICEWWPAAATCTVCVLISTNARWFAKFAKIKSRENLYAYGILRYTHPPEYND